MAAASVAGRTAVFPSASSSCRTAAALAGVAPGLPFEQSEDQRVQAAAFRERV
jgi:hypothetical protein